MAFSRGIRLGALTMVALALQACATADSTLEPPPDAPPQPDAAPDGSPDGASDAAPDGSPDATPDATPDAAPDGAPDGGPGDACTNAPNITAAASQPGGTVLNGDTTGEPDNVLTPFACTGYATDGPDDVYAITVVAGDVVSITMQPTTSWDASLELVAACGEVACLAGADDELSGEAESLQHTFASAGTFYIVADGYNPGVAGPYTLTVILTHP